MTTVRNCPRPYISDVPLVGVITQV